MPFFSGCYTDIGTCKQVNQDAYGVRIVGSGTCQVAFAIVCDGVGGMTKGEIASGVVVCAFLDWFRQATAELLTNQLAKQDLFQQWHATAEQANQLLIAYGQQQEFQLGTTATVLLAMHRKIYVMNIGDSRLYVANKQGFHQITRDHTLVQHEVELGILSPKDARTNRRSHILTRCIGAESQVQPDFYAGNIQDGSVYLLCTDGLRNALAPSLLYQTIRPDKQQGEFNLTEQLRLLANQAKDQGERDNMTGVAIWVHPSQEAEDVTVDLENTVSLLHSEEWVYPGTSQLWYHKQI